MRIDAPAGLIEVLEPGDLPGWDDRDPSEARRFGDRWLDEGRTPVLSVPAVPRRPVGHLLLVNPQHSDAGRIAVSEPFDVPWDERPF